MVELLTRDIMPGLTFIFETGSLVAQAYFRLEPLTPVSTSEVPAIIHEQLVFSLFANQLFVPEPHFCL